MVSGMLRMHGIVVVSDHSLIAFSKSWNPVNCGSIGIVVVVVKIIIGTGRLPGQRVGSVIVGTARKCYERNTNIAEFLYGKNDFETQHYARNTIAITKN